MYIQNGPDNCDNLNGDVVVDKVTWIRGVGSHLDDWRWCKEPEKKKKKKI